MNRNFPRTIWIWQTIVSPHMAGLAAALARRGCNVTYVAEQVMSADRALQGWSPPLLEDVRLELVSSPESVCKLVASVARGFYPYLCRSPGKWSYQTVSGCIGPAAHTAMDCDGNG